MNPWSVLSQQLIQPSFLKTIRPESDGTRTGTYRGMLVSSVRSTPYFSQVQKHHHSMPTIPSQTESHSEPDGTVRLTFRKIRRLIHLSVQHLDRVDGSEGNSTPSKYESKLLSRRSFRAWQSTLRDFFDEAIQKGELSYSEAKISSALPPSPWKQDALERTFVEEKSFSGLLNNVVLPCIHYLNTMIKQADPKSPYDRLTIQAMMKKMRSQLEQFLVPDPDYIPKSGAPKAFKVAEDIYESTAFEIRNLFEEAHILGRLSLDPKVIQQATLQNFIDIRSQLLTHMTGVMASILDARRVQLNQYLLPENSTSQPPTFVAYNQSIQHERDKLKSCKHLLHELRACSMLARGSHETFDLYTSLFEDIQSWIARGISESNFNKEQLDHLTTLLTATLPHVRQQLIAQPALTTLINITKRLKRGESVTEFSERYLEQMDKMVRLDSTKTKKPNVELLSATMSEKKLKRVLSRSKKCDYVDLPRITVTTLTPKGESELAEVMTALEQLQGDLSSATADSTTN